MCTIGLSGWVIDRLYEAGGEDMLPDFVNASLTVPDVGKWTALALLVGFEVGKAAASISMPLPSSIKVMGMDKALGFTQPAQDLPTKKAREEKKAEFMDNIQQFTKVQSQLAAISCPLNNISVHLLITLQITLVIV